MQFYNKLLMEQNEMCEMWAKGLPHYPLMGFEKADEKEKILFLSMAKI